MRAMSRNLLARAIEIMKPGRHPAMSGEIIEFTDADLTASAEAYDPAKHEAPIVVGHPRTDAPAYGWVEGLSYADSLMSFRPRQVEPQFAEMVNKGRFKKRSASFFPPDHPRNPVPGIYYLRHVGFLGAMPPAVKGLKDATFADDGRCVEIEFAEADFADTHLWAVARMMRNVREWIIERFSTEEADRVLPNHMVDEVEQSMREQDDSAANQFSETEETEMNSGENKAKLEALIKENETLKAQHADFSEREEQLTVAERARQKQETADFVEGLVKAGKVLPRYKAGLAEYLAAVPGDATIEFADGDNQVTQDGGKFIRSFLESLPVQVDYSERSAANFAENPEHDAIEMEAKAIAQASGRAA